ncbi:MAG: hypothetical protein QM757_06340 [Paludibaculum sp.]
MSEITKSEQARINGRRSRGPVTAGGKARSANNARKHGRYARPLPEPVHPILLKCENGAAYQDVLHRLFQDILPTNSFEIALVREVCAIEWLITRNFAVQTRLLDVQVAAECDAIRRGQGSLRGIEPIDGIALATEKLLTSSNVLAQSRREFTRLQRARREAMNMIFSLRNHQQSLVRSRELPDAEDFDRRTAEGDIHRNEPTDWPLESPDFKPEIPEAAEASERAAETAPPVDPSTPQTTTEPGPEREPAREVTLEREPQRKSDSESKPEPEPEPKPEHKLELEPELESELDSESEPKPELELELERERQSERQSEPAREPESESESESEPKPEVEMEPERKSESEPEPEPEQELEWEWERERESDSEPKLEPERERESKPKPKPELDRELERELGQAPIPQPGPGAIPASPQSSAPSPGLGPEHQRRANGASSTESPMARRAPNSEEASTNPAHQRGPATANRDCQGAGHGHHRVFKGIPHSPAGRNAV